MESNKDRWHQFNSIIDNKNLNYKEKAILLIIFRYVDNKTGYAHPSRERLKKLSNIKENRTLDNILNSLLSKGYLTKKTSRGIRTKYYINVNPSNEVGVKNTSLVGVENTSLVGVENTPQKENKKNIWNENLNNSRSSIVELDY